MEVRININSHFFHVFISDHIFDSIIFPASESSKNRAKYKTLSLFPIERMLGPFKTEKEARAAWTLLGRKYLYDVYMEEI